MSRRTALALLAAYLLLPALLTLGPEPRDALAAFRTVLDAVTVGSPTQAQAEVTANVVMLVPVGLLGALAWPRAPLLLIAAVIAVGSATVEVVQGAMLSAREPHLRDVVANLAGAGLGVALARVRRERTPE